MVAGYLGPKGTYSEIAAKKLCERYILREYPSFYSAFEALQKRECDKIVMPIENALQGSVTQVLDLLYDSGATITLAATLKISHNLIVKRGSALKDITDVYSHEQAIKQCGKFLHEKLPAATLHYTSSTAQGASLIKSLSDAAIGSFNLASGDLVSAFEDIGDEKGNRTMFAVIEKDNELKKSERIFFATGGDNRPGGLLEILQVIKNHDLNMTRIESRPVKQRYGSYLFFIEAEGDISDGNVKECLEMLKRRGDFRLLGAYSVKNIG